MSVRWQSRAYSTTGVIHGEPGNHRTLRRRINFRGRDTPPSAYSSGQEIPHCTGWSVPLRRSKFKDVPTNYEELYDSSDENEEADVSLPSQELMAEEKNHFFLWYVGKLSN